MRCSPPTAPRPRLSYSLHRKLLLPTSCYSHATLQGSNGTTHDAPPFLLTNSIPPHLLYCPVHSEPARPIVHSVSPTFERVAVDAVESCCKFGFSICRFAIRILGRNLLPIHRPSLFFQEVVKFECSQQVVFPPRINPYLVIDAVGVGPCTGRLSLSITRCDHVLEPNYSYSKSGL